MVNRIITKKAFEVFHGYTGTGKGKFLSKIGLSCRKK